ncbi:MAG: hypothetical protein ABFC80_09325 [Coriobacteriales bacterium]|nr:hypothetical protein [Nocardiaceae bacterium]
MRKLTNDELAKARDAEDWGALWLAARPLVKFTIKRMIQRGEIDPSRWADDDLKQEGLLAAGLAVRSWDTLEGAFSTWVSGKIRTEILSHLQGEGNGGVGGSRRGGKVSSLQEPFKSESPGCDDDEDEDDKVTRLDMLTYPEDEVIPSPETAMNRETALRLLDRLGPFDRDVARRAYGFDGKPQSIREIAAAHDVSFRQVHTAIARVGTLLGCESESC